MSTSFLTAYGSDSSNLVPVITYAYHVLQKPVMDLDLVTVVPKVNITNDKIS
jgi:hypothetical protein